MLNRSSLTPIYPASLSNCAADSHSRRACRYQHRRKRCRIFAPSAPPKLAVGAGQDIKKRERSNAQVDCRCLRSDLGVISTGFATRIPPAARQTGHSNPRSMRRRFAPREWRLRENSRPPCRQQVRPRSDLLNFDCASGRSASSGHARILATLLRGSVGARLHSAGNANRSLSLVMVDRTGGVALTLSGPNPSRPRA